MALFTEATLVFSGCGHGQSTQGGSDGAAAGGAALEQLSVE